VYKNLHINSVYPISISNISISIIPIYNSQKDFQKTRNIGYFIYNTDRDREKTKIEKL